jgi:hypothetical protein
MKLKSILVSVLVREISYFSLYLEIPQISLRNLTKSGCKIGASHIYHTKCNI